MCVCAIFKCHDSSICAMTHWYVPWLINMCHDSLIGAMTHWYVTIYMHTDVCHPTRRVLVHCVCERDANVVTDWYVPWLMHMCSSHMLHDSLICHTSCSHVTWLIHMWHDSFICDMTHSYGTHSVSLSLSLSLYLSMAQSQSQSQFQSLSLFHMLSHQLNLIHRHPLYGLTYVHQNTCVYGWGWADTTACGRDFEIETETETETEP